MIDIRNLNPVGYGQYTSADLASAITLGTTVPSGGGVVMPAGTRVVVVESEAQAVRWRDDGTAPTAAIGMPLAAGADFTYTGKPNKLQFIRQVAGAILNVSYYA